MQTPRLELKGSSFTLSVLHINSQDMAVITAELDSKLAIAPQFFLGAPLVVNLSAIKTSNFDLLGLKEILTSRQLIIVGITSALPEINEMAKSIGLAIIKSGKAASNQPQMPKTTKIVKQNIRSGQQIYAKNGDLIVIGAVGNGAEVIADGSIHIYGTLRGKAMAGAAGDRNAVIMAQKIEAELVSIAGQYWLTENLQQNGAAQSGCIRLEGESLTVESLPL
ncbi:septum site-determining protein MinC [Shewanella sp. Choline-02u-19]|uniref:septum site-determining protein MinC n=1 Tax=unclassified Shewanella TaxID=196818 RepID=UPI000C339EFB|nr:MULTISPECIES: septum site-determining protein MinC [unclassified Shewanella]PKG57376.1 septum site-determining protein MinC [Shewanella sp. GutDb-MelDb]PKG75486.1 septum site-determining protein MinC [Shewanella sp. GutCb]PKH56189.1 septum site-determining protein MinC [Shewanella sp. Bg11-22]PKI29321.1 septum site-determining protein MinC [Shewanella sp. Choline-02u-19]